MASCGDSQVTVRTMLEIHNVPAFDDNYLWLIHHQGSQNAYVIDPGDAVPVEAALASHGLILKGILVTHHHADHTGGIGALTKNRDIPVYGPDSEKISHITDPLKDGETLSLEGGLIEFTVLAVPGHTLDHIAYYNQSDEALFCGDTLFAGGCGRMFEGHAEQMHQSLQKLAQLPGSTRVFCAHEYTAANLKFAQAVEPDNQDLQNRITATRQLRSSDRPTVPSLMQQELGTNPFLRVTCPSVIQAAEHYNKAQLREPYQVFGALRGWKDNF